jgi:type II secretory pathway component PulJ
MTKQQLFETSANRASQETTQIETLIGRLARTAELMDADINQEEKLASVSDPRDPAYPMIARSLKGRRDNLTASISSLQALVNTGRNSTYSKQEEKASQSTAQIETLIRRLARTAEIMDADIKHEEKLAQVSDPRDPAYPMVAQSLKARRDNLRASIISLQSLLNAGGPQRPTARSVTAHD